MGGSFLPPKGLTPNHLWCILCVKSSLRKYFAKRYISISWLNYKTMESFMKQYPNTNETFIYVPKTLNASKAHMSICRYFSFPERLALCPAPKEQKERRVHLRLRPMELELVYQAWCRYSVLVDDVTFSRFLSILVVLYAD